MKNLGLSLRAAAVVVCILLAWPAAGANAAEDATTPDERVARLEAELQAAKAEIERLKAELDDAKQQLAAAGGEKPAKPAAKKKADESADFFPKGTKVSGTFTGSNAGALAMSGSVLNRSATGMTLRLKTSNATRDYDIRIRNGSAAIASTRIVAGDSKVSFIDINVSGRITADTLSMSGSWRTKGPGGSKSANVSFDLKTE